MKIKIIKIQKEDKGTKKTRYWQNKSMGIVVHTKILWFIFITRRLLRQNRKAPKKEWIIKKKKREKNLWSIVQSERDQYKERDREEGWQWNDLFLQVPSI